jgi:hypothetical protein
MMSNREPPRRRCDWPLLLLGLVLSAVSVRAGESSKDAAPPQVDPAALEFFERSVRPILVERCQGCHGPAKQKGKLRLDSRRAALAGGSTGPAVKPGHPEQSLLIDAIKYGDLFQMPPKSKLPKEEIALLTRWVEQGAPWGFESRAAVESATRGESKAAPAPGLDSPGEFQRRAKQWCFQPLRRDDPPMPVEPRPSWSRNPIDKFLLAAMQRNGLSPAPEADKRTLIRRLSFDLIGLPPTPAEVAAFLADGTPEAYERLVDRLLASPHHGERWARHWLDLVRFAETAGHEFDYETPSAYRYRDYVIRALNIDLPYRKFVIEQVAGDLLATPRRDPGTGLNESILGTGFFFLGEGTHSPVDVREDQVRRIDNQIDVFAKCFLGLTVACARCHDHKFDPIRSKDYYALAGFLKSSRHQQAFIDGPDRIAARANRLKELKQRIRVLLFQAEPHLPIALRNSVMAAITTAPAPASSPAPSASFFEAFDRDRFDGWFVTGLAFGDRPTAPGDFRLDAGHSAAWLIPVNPGQAHSGLVSPRLQGVLRSQSFTIEKRFVHCLVSGQAARINVVVDGFEKIRDPIYGGLTLEVNVGDQPRWITQDLSMWLGHRAYLELADGAVADYSGTQTRMEAGHGYLAIAEVRLSDQPPPREAVRAEPVPIRLDALLPTIRNCDSLLAGRLEDALAEYRSIESAIPDPSLGLAIADGTSEDEYLLVRGSHANPGEPVPRRFLEVLGVGDPTTPAGSGRLELARHMVDARSNPLLPRVIVNRLWQHHFGEGLVKTPDDFGAMGQKPSHPELLDWLAAELVQRGWSLKAMHRLMVNSSAYRMSSSPRPEADRLDPADVQLHRMTVRRLEAETIRDALMMVCGRLDRQMFGPSIPPYLSPFMDGRGRPARSGPLDGDGRRSIYLSVRRNFLNPMSQSFDAPVPFSTMGRRNLSNVPAQALALLNDPLVLHLSDLWAGHLLVDPERSDRDRVALLFETALARRPTDVELRRCLAFLESDPACSSHARKCRAWADLCHVLFNVKEFIYID